MRMRRFADLDPGNGKTDAKDGFHHRRCARTLPDTLLPIGEASDLVEGLRMLSEFGADLAVDENRLINGLRSVPFSVNPALGRANDAQMHCPVGPGLLAKFGGPAGFAAASRRHLDSYAEGLAPRRVEEGRQHYRQCTQRADRQCPRRGTG
ncbi:MAG: transposase [Rhodococcus sp. (in: high G+C Gram-positive bacteria)]|uniref:IS110 family transposase n=1 Tax=Rhodococcus sp. TaxID=1831 RepID=UPI0033149782